MASLQQEATGTWHVVLRIEGKRYKRSLKTKKKAEANFRKEEIQETLNLLKLGKIRIPVDCPAIDYVLYGEESTSPSGKPSVAKTDTAVLKDVFEYYFDSIPDGSIEKCTLDMLRTHEKHLLRILRPSFDLSCLTSDHLQKYVKKRSQEQNIGFCSHYKKRAQYPWHSLALGGSFIQSEGRVSSKSHTISEDG